MGYYEYLLVYPESLDGLRSHPTPTPSWGTAGGTENSALGVCPLADCPCSGRSLYTYAHADSTNWNLIQFYFMCVGVFACVYVCVPSVCLLPSETRKKASDSLELELGVAVSLCVGDRNWTLVLWKSVQHS